MWFVKKDKLMLFNNFSINLNAQQINEMTHFNSHVNVRLLDTLKY